jgi:hypothetical protein
LRGVSNKTVDDLIDQIRMVDSAACSWLSLMSGVNLNIFKGRYLFFLLLFDFIDIFKSFLF